MDSIGQKGSMKNKTIKVEFEISKSVWASLPKDLRNKATMAEAGLYKITPADKVAFVVLESTVIANS
jgi:hypothetical protein